MSIPETASDRLHHLDSSRGVAAFVVVLSHFVLAYFSGLNSTILARTPLHLAWDGSAAVIYFFIHSGFILAWRLKQRNVELSNSSYASFLIRRIFRIYPLFLVALAGMFLVQKSTLFFRYSTLPDLPLRDMYWKSSASLLDLFKQSLLALRLPQDPALRLLPQDWSLSIEMSVSLLFPVLFFVFSKRTGLYMVAVYLAVQLLALDKFVFDFSLGMLALHLQAPFKSWWTDKATIAWKLALLTLAVLVTSSNHFLSPTLYTRMDLLLIHTKAWGCALFLLLIISSGTLKKILSLRLLVWQGRFSYGIYLIHLTGIIAALAIFGTNPASLPALFFMFYGSVFLLSGLLYVLVEKPFISIGKRLADKFFPPG